MRIAGYEFAPGARFQAGVNASPAEVGQHLELLRTQQKGELTPADVLKDAKNRNSPLHSFFEWDDGAAAERHRLDQARSLIRSVVAIYVHDDKPATRIRAYVHVREPGANHYREIGHAMSLKKTREMILKQAWREFQAWKKRYKDLEEFSVLFLAAEQVAEKLPALQDGAG